MSTEIAGLPFWTLMFDTQGDTDQQRLDEFCAEVRDRGITDLIMFSHGWNNDLSNATQLYDGFFGVLAGQVPAGRTVGLAGVYWPSQRWSDEPIPDFKPPAGPAGGGAAALAEPAGELAAADPRIDAETLKGLRQTFPQATAQLDRMAELLAEPPTDSAVTEFGQLMREFATTAGPGADDAEEGHEPGMLADEPDVLFSRYADELRRAGVPVDDAAGGEAGLGDRLRGIWNGAKEALRQLTYWQMKNRAGVVGRAGLGPAIGRLHQSAPTVLVHLVGHSFGGRLVSCALSGLPAGLDPSPVRSVTLLQGAFSHFAFADPLPFNANRKGALAGMLDRVDGPLTVCFSSHDGALGTFYPLASLANQDDAAGLSDALFRWGAMGADGAQGVSATPISIQGAGPAASYPFAVHEVLNVDAAEVVSRGGPPVGAHNDIVHPELTWIVLAAGGIV